MISSVHVARARSTRFLTKAGESVSNRISSNRPSRSATVPAIAASAHYKRLCSITIGLRRSAPIEIEGGKDAQDATLPLSFCRICRKRHSRLRYRFTAGNHVSHPKSSVSWKKLRNFTNQILPLAVVESFGQDRHVICRAREPGSRSSPRSRARGSLESAPETMSCILVDPSVGLANAGPYHPRLAPTIACRSVWSPA